MYEYHRPLLTRGCQTLPRTPDEAKEEKLMQGLVEGKTKVQAALDAGYGNGNYMSAATAATRKLGSDEFRLKLRARLEERRMGTDYALDGLHRVITAQKMGLTKDGLAVAMGDDGIAQAKGVEMLLKVLDAFPNPRVDVNATLAGSVVILRPDDLVSVDPFSEAIDVSPTGQTG